MLERFLLLWLTLLSLAAFAWPECFGTRFDPFIASAPGLNYLIAVTMLAVGSLLPRDEVEQLFRRGSAVLGGTTVQYAVMPLLAYGFGRLFGLEGPYFIGIVVVGCVPGAMASNVLTLMARGNTSYSVSLTTSATILSPVMVPFTLWLALKGTHVSIPWGETLVKLCWMVVLPVVMGHLLSRNSPRWASLARRIGGIIANLAILWIIAVVVAKNRVNLLKMEPRLFTALLCVNLAGFTAGFFGGKLLRLPTPMRRALTLEVGMQNAGLGAVLAQNLFDDPATCIAPAMYTFGCMFTGTILARWWAARQPAEQESDK